MVAVKETRSMGASGSVDEEEDEKLRKMALVVTILVGLKCTAAVRKDVAEVLLLLPVFPAFHNREVVVVLYPRLLG